MADYLKLPEVARRLDVSEKTARRMVRSGKLPAVFIGGAYRVSVEDLTKYLQNARVEPGKVPAPPAPQRSFNGLLEEERRTRDLERIERIGRALHALWRQAVDRNQFDLEAYDRTGEAYLGLDAALADAMTEEFTRDEEGASDEYRGAWNRAWQATDGLGRELQRAYNTLEASGVTDLNEYRSAHPGVAGRRSA